jgi:hypothetical protein
MCPTTATHVPFSKAEETRVEAPSAGCYWQREGVWDGPGEGDRSSGGGRTLLGFHRGGQGMMGQGKAFFFVRGVPKLGIFHLSVAGRRNYLGQYYRTVGWGLDGLDLSDV